MEKKKKRTTTKIFFQVIKNTALGSALVGYLITFLATSLVILLCEPSITNFWDAMWYSFSSCTTMGFGDLLAVTTLGRIVTVILYIYTIIIIALITAVLTHFFIEIEKARRNKSVSMFQYDLEHLDELPKERLKEMSEQVKKFRNK